MAVRLKDPSFLPLYFDADVVLEKVCENDVNGNPIYIGWAQPGTPYNSPNWLISKQTYDANSSLISQKLANNSASFAFAWTDRATYF